MPIILLLRVQRYKKHFHTHLKNKIFHQRELKNGFETTFDEVNFTRIFFVDKWGGVLKGYFKYANG